MHKIRSFFCIITKHFSGECIPSRHHHYVLILSLCLIFKFVFSLSFSKLFSGYGPPNRPLKLATRKILFSGFASECIFLFLQRPKSITSLLNVPLHIYSRLNDCRAKDVRVLAPSPQSTRHGCETMGI